METARPVEIAPARSQVVDSAPNNLDVIAVCSNRIPRCWLRFPESVRCRLSSVFETRPDPP
jgi:hypothetical protein